MEGGADVTVADKRVIVDISAAQALGYEPAHDLKSGFATVWPEFSEGTS